MIRSPRPGTSSQISNSQHVWPGSRPKKPPIRVHFSCAMEGCTFTSFRYKVIEEHMELRHRCSLCGNNFSEVDSHINRCPQRGAGARRRGIPPIDRGPPDLAIFAYPFVESGRFHLGTILVYEYTPTEVICVVADLVESLIVSIRRLLAELVRHFGGIRVSFRVFVDLIEEAQNFRVQDRPVGSSWSIISHLEFIDDAIFNCFTYIILALNYFNEGSSNFLVERLTRLDIHIGEYSPLSPRGFIQIPSILKSKQTLLNIRGTGSRCFHYCVLAHMYGEAMSEAMISGETVLNSEAARVGKRQKKAKSQKSVNLYKRKKTLTSQAKNYKEYFGISGIDFSMINTTPSKGCNLHDISKFEMRNDISVNVFGHVHKDIVPRRLTPSAKKIHVNIMILEKGTESHFILIRDLSRFLGHGQDARHVFCPQCLKPYIQKSALKKHLEVCGTDDLETQLIPTEDTFRFIKYENTRTNDYCMYFAIQEQEFTIREEKESKEGSTSTLREGGTFQREKTKLVPIAYALIMIGPGGKIENQAFGMGQGAMKELIELAMNWAGEIREILKKTNNFIPLTPYEKESHRLAQICGACLQPFSKNDPKVLDHCHTSGLYQGAKHNTCNLRIRMPRIIQAVTLNCTKTWYRHLICALDSVSYECKVKPTMKSPSEMAGITINGMLRFTNLVNYRPNETFYDLVRARWIASNQFPLLAQLKPTLSEEFISNLAEVVAPDPVYESEIQMLRECKSKIFLGRDMLRNADNKSKASNREYELYFDYYNHLACHTTKKYIRYKLTHRAVLIAEIMERIRRVAYSNYGLEILNSWTIASYTFQCCFYFDRLEIGVITCPRIAKLADELMRGGYQVMNRKSVQSNTTMYGNLDPEKSELIILFSDIIQSYAHCMTNYLPDGNYAMMSRAELDNFDFKNPTFDTGTGYCFQVSLTLDEKNHDFFSDMPLSPEHYNVVYESTGRDGVGNVYTESKRYLATLLPKSEKTYYYKTLAFMLQSGFQLVSVHQGYKFSESKFLAPYVVHNTKLRYAATNDMDNRSCKSMLNFLAGKFMVNQNSYPSTRFCFSSIMSKQLLAQDNFEDVLLIDKNVSLFKLKKPSGIDFNFRGTAGVILELGRLELYKLYYLGLKRQFGAAVRLVYSNTDSLLCTIKCKESIYLEKMKSLTSIFDFSNLPVNSPLFDESNKNCPGKLKICEHNITEFLGVGVSTYSILTENDEAEANIMKCRGIPRDAAQKSIRHEHFRGAVENSLEQKVEFDTVRVENNATFRVKVGRCALRNADTSRVFFGNSFSLPYGHYFLKARSNNTESNTN